MLPFFFEDAARPEADHHRVRIYSEHAHALCNADAQYRRTPLSPASSSTPASSPAPLTSAHPLTKPSSASKLVSVSSSASSWTRKDSSRSTLLNCREQQRRAARVSSRSITSSARRSWPRALSWRNRWSLRRIWRGSLRLARSSELRTPSEQLASS